MVWVAATGGETGTGEARRSMVLHGKVGLQELPLLIRRDAVLRRLGETAKLSR